MIYWGASDPHTTRHRRHAPHCPQTNELFEWFRLRTRGVASQKEDRQTGSNKHSKYIGLELETLAVICIYL